MSETPAHLEDPKPRKTPTQGERIGTVEAATEEMANAVAQQSNALVALAAGQEAQEKTLDNIGELLRGLTARQAPVGVKAFDVRDGNLSYQQDIDVGEDNHGNMKIVETARDPKDTAEWLHSQAELETFMAEELVIYIHPSPKAADAQIADLSVNGKVFILPRGKEVTVPRYVVEVLARGAPFEFRAIDTEDPRRSNRYRYVGVAAGRYPFAIHNDPSGDRGVAWKSQIEEEARLDFGVTA